MGTAAVDAPLHSQHVDLEQFTQRFGRRVFNSPVVPATGVVHKHIEAPKARGPGDERADVFVVAHIARQSQRLDAVACSRAVRGLANGCAVDIPEDYAAAALGKRERSRPADAAPRARDNDDGAWRQPGHVCYQLIRFLSRVVPRSHNGPGKWCRLSTTFSYASMK